MKKVCKNVIRDCLRCILGKKGYTYARFILTHGYHPNFKQPRTFSEKLIARKFSEESLRFSKYVDKYTSRNFVKDKIGEKYLIPLIAQYDKLSVDDFKSLPDSFVIKTSNGGGGENVLIVKNKETLDFHSVCKRFNQYLTIKIGSKIDEPFYDIEKPKIIIEELVSYKDGIPPIEYKFHVFKDTVLIQENVNYNTPMFTKTLYEIDGSVSSIQFENCKAKKSKLELSNNFNEMVNVAKELSKDFEYVRVDLYDIGSKIYFGEMTFCHASGWDKLNSKASDLKLGSYWNEF